MLNRNALRAAWAYAAIQAAIWAKCALFFCWFGRGKVMQFSIGLFPGNAIFFDYYFHETMHVLIGICALWFGKNIGKFEITKVTVIVFAAVALHDGIYWLTASHPSPAYSAVDFARDSVLLFAFVAAGFALGRLCGKPKQKD